MIASLLLFLASVVFLFGCGEPGTEFKRSGTPALKLEVRQASAQSGAGDGWMAVPSPQSQGKSLYLSPDVVLSNDDIASTGTSKNSDSGLPQIDVRLSEDAKRRFAATTTEMVGSKTSPQMLAFLVDGKVLFAPLVLEPITNGQIGLRRQWSEAEAKRVARGIVMNAAD